MHEKCASALLLLMSCNSSALLDNNYLFAVVRVYEEVGHVDPNGAQTIKNAWAGGMAHVDGYIFPCLRCGNPAQQVFYLLVFHKSLTSIVRFFQVTDTVNHLRQEGANFGMLWFDIEGAYMKEYS